jgi:cytochrome P450
MSRPESGPRGWPFLGGAPAAGRDPLAFFTGTAQRYGDTVDMKLVGQRVIMVNRPDLIQHVLQRNFEGYRKSKFYGRLKPLMGEGFLTSEGETWLAQRRTGAPAFNGQALAQMCRQMAEATADHLDAWQAPARAGTPVDVADEMMRLTLDIAMRTLFGTRLTDTTARELSEGLALVLREAEARIWSPVSLPFWVPTARNRAFRAAIADMDRIFAELVAQRKADGPQGDLLDMMIEGYDDDPQMLRDLVLSILMAGHETTGAGLAWSFHLLAQNPEAAAKLRAEAESVLGGGVPSDMKTLQQLPYARAVFEETMRLYPPVWTFSRDALRPDRLGETEVRTGDTVMVCAYAVHRDPRLWDAPESFRPERFLNDADRRRHKYAYIPFGGGPRTCLGNRFAMTEAVIALAATAQRYELVHAEAGAVKPEPMITLRPKGGLRMTPRSLAATPATALDSPGAAGTLRRAS